MARGVNKVILVGNLGNDPEVRYTASGAAITTISVATSESWKDKQTGEQQERTEWHRVKFFGRLAEIACPVLLTASTADSVLYEVGPAQLAMAAAIPDSRLFLATQGDHPLMWSNAAEFRRVADAFLAQWTSEEREE